MLHVFIVGSKGIPARYGGFESFVENLTLGKKSEDIMYHVSCMDNDEKHFDYNGADCFNIRLPLKGAAGRILHVSRVLSFVEKWKEKNLKEKAVVYILGCRIGPFLIPHAMKLHNLGIRILINPDGLEWKRNKWSKLEKVFLKYCEKCLVLNSDLVICDSQNIEKYIIETYPIMKGKTTYIAYGADLSLSTCPRKSFDMWLAKYNLTRDNYYLIVGRFVPENNYEIMITEFMKSNTKKKLVIISNIERNKFYEELRVKTNYESDERIKFIGTVYECELLKKIREEAFAYIHGHEVGGTNPSLLEAMASTKVNLLLNVGFNKEVAEKTALYWNKDSGSLSCLINEIERGNLQENLEDCKERILNNFSWNEICEKYENIFKL